MNFPFYTPPALGKGMVIGLNAVTHVWLSHGIAIGLFAAIVLAEFIAYRRHNHHWETWAQFFNKPTTLVISSFASITGVGIWFTIGPLAPRAASSMLRIFFWPWYIEFIVFFLEQVVLLVYYFTWERMNLTPPRKRWHIRLGVTYVILAALSTFLISGIIGYMLTPDGWPWNRTFWHAYANESLAFQALLRFFGGLTIGFTVAIALAIFNWKPIEFKRDAIGIFGLLLGIFMLACAISTNFFFYLVPSRFKAYVPFSILTSHFSQNEWIFPVVNWFMFGLFCLFIIVCILRLYTPAKMLVIPAIIITILFTTEFERIREFIRGPFLMPGYMWVSQVLMKETPYYASNDILEKDWWFNAAHPNPGFQQQAQMLFALNCSTCHTIGGLNDIRDRLRGRPPDAIPVILAHTNQMVPWMPPFSGSPKERRILSQYLYEITNTKPQNPPTHFPQLSTRSTRSTPSMPSMPSIFPGSDP